MGQKWSQQFTEKYSLAFIDWCFSLRQNLIFQYLTKEKQAVRTAAANKFLAKYSAQTLKFANIH